MAAGILVALATWGLLVVWVSYEGLYENSEPAGKTELILAGLSALLGLLSFLAAALGRYRLAAVFAACACLPYVLLLLGVWTHPA